MLLSSSLVYMQNTVLNKIMRTLVFPAAKKNGYKPDILSFAVVCQLEISV